MGKVIAVEHLTLDGVMQSPGSADEDPRDGFVRGGWASRHQDPVMQKVMGARMGASWSLLAGRRTYDQFATYWPAQEPNPFTEALTRVRKYVVSTTLNDPLPWQNSVLLKGDAVEAVSRLRAEEADNLVVFGSGELVRSLLPHGLVDELVLMVHPLVLGSGRRLFACSGSDLSAFEVAESLTTDTGVFVGVYRPAGH
ncbi:dihydrofolate reductase family protein [Actinopolymorpha rutila]|uniref:Dihydrofolate reductase n=1 Tax=Actinopolymorpha rutila TaxID=446787 RepID=A0A852Z7V1_9ACTN|nr:dihydrofolate reductase family protein [Actinopolymorpha rutila]NYH89031.1 dihydrofolate reductase [Actinopolymorpha rutila]